MNTDDKEKAVKPAYESVSCDVVDVEMLGVLCESSSEGLTGGLTLYSGSEL